MKENCICCNKQIGNPEKNETELEFCNKCYNELEYLQIIQFRLINYMYKKGKNVFNSDEEGEKLAKELNEIGKERNLDIFKENTKNLCKNLILDNMEIHTKNIYNNIKKIILENKYN